MKLEILDDEACTYLTGELRTSALEHSEQITELARELVGVLNDHLIVENSPAAAVLTAAVVLTRAISQSMPGYSHTIVAQVMLRMAITADICAIETAKQAMQ